MLRYILLIAVASASSVFVMTQRGSPDPFTPSEAVTEALEAIRVGFADAYSRGDVSALLAYYDAQYVDASVGAALRGKHDMRAAFEGTFAQYVGALDIRPEEVLAHGDWALERGTFSIHLTDRGSGVEMVSHRRYQELLVRRDDGRWYIFRDLDNELPVG